MYGPVLRLLLEAFPFAGPVAAAGRRAEQALPTPLRWTTAGSAGSGLFYAVQAVEGQGVPLDLQSRKK